MALKDDVLWGVLKERSNKARQDNSKEKAQRLYERLHTKQRWVLDDPHRFKAVLCPRRAGKSYCLAAYILITCLLKAKANVLFIAQTRERAKDILWEIIKILDREYELGIRFSEVYLSGRLPNGSRFRLSGCETKADIEKYRGEAYHLVLLDECASHSPELLEQLITRALEPALADHKGTLVLAGTPGHVLAGPFFNWTGPPAFEPLDKDDPYKITSRPYDERDQVKWARYKWSISFHHWSKQDNTALPHLWEEALARKERNGWSDQHPVFLREDLGLWAADDTILCYKFLYAKNTWSPKDPGLLSVKSLPQGHVWHFVMGLDLGSGRTDRFALQVVAYSDTHKDLFHVYEYIPQEPKSFTQMGVEIKKVTDVLDIERIVGDLDQLGDAITLQWMEELQVVVERAQKKNKRDHIELVNGDLQEGRIWILRGSYLQKQMEILAWDETGIKEMSGQRNDAADAFVYTIRICRHRFFEEKMYEPPKGTPAWHAKQEEEEIDRLVLHEERMKHPELFDNDNPGDDAEWSWQ